MRIKIAVLLALFVAMVGLAYHIEVKARPMRNVRGQMVGGETRDHAH